MQGLPAQQFQDHKGGREMTAEQEFIIDINSRINKFEKNGGNITEAINIIKNINPQNDDMRFCLEYVIGELERRQHK